MWDCFAGELSAHCVGPHKVAYCELYDHGDGTFTLNVKPQEPGKHTLTVKYGGNAYFKFAIREYVSDEDLQGEILYRN